MVIRYASAEPPRLRIRAGGPALYAEPELPMRVRLGEKLMLIGASLRKRRLRMMLVAALPLALALAYVQAQPTLYETAAAVFIDPQNARSGRSEIGDSGIMEGQMRLATSKTVLDRAIEREKLGDDPTFLPRSTGLKALIKGMISGEGKETQSSGEDRSGAVLARLSQSIRPRRGEGTNLIDIGAVASDPETAMRIANAVAQSFVDELISGADSTQGAERARISRRGEELKSRLREAEARLNAYRAQNGLNVAPSRSTGSEADGPALLSRARAAALEARTRYEQIQKLMTSGKETEAVADFLRSPSIERLRIQYNEAAAQEGSFRTSLGPRHPAYLEALEQAREKKRLFLEGLRLAASAARADWQAARDQEGALEARHGSATVSATVQPTPTALLEHERNVEAARAAYDRYIRSFDAPDSTSQSATARVVAMAPLPLAAISGLHSSVWSAALLSSALLTALLALYGIVRDLTSGAGPTAPVVRTRVRPEVQAASPPPQEEAPAIHPRAQAVQPVPPVAAPRQPLIREDSALVLLAFELAERCEQFPLQTVLVTAVDGDCAKSELALELAREARKLSLRVLILDVDEATAAITLALCNGPDAGLITVHGRERRAIAIDPELEGICCLVPSEVVPLPANNSNPRLLGGIAGNFDLVILDGPAMSGSVLERKLARAAQIVMVAHAEGKPNQARIAGALGAPHDAIRLVDTGMSLSAPTVRGTRPMTVIRMKKCA